MKIRVPLTVATLALLGWPALAAASATLAATVRVDGATTLVNEAATAVTSLHRGTYVLHIRDRSHRCGFRLVGATGVVAQTGARFVGNVSRTIRLQRGEYTYSCGSKSRHTLRVA
jgi:hypothetical protein